MTKYIEVKPGGRRFAYSDEYAAANPHLKVVDLEELEKKAPPKPDYSTWTSKQLRAEVRRLGHRYESKQQALDILNDIS